MSEETPTSPANGFDDHAPSPAPVTSGGTLAAPRAAQSVPTTLRIGIASVAAAMLLWGTWVSKDLYDLRHHANRIVKVRLSDLIADYVQTAARSGVPAEQAAQQTGTFLKILNDTVEAHRSQDQVVMLANAIVAGDVPDITEQVRAEVSTKVASPRAGGSGDVQGQMKRFMDANAASSTGGAAHGQ